MQQRGKFTQQQREELRAILEKRAEPNYFELSKHFRCSLTMIKERVIFEKQLMKNPRGGAFKLD